LATGDFRVMADKKKKPKKNSLDMMNKAFDKAMADPDSGISLGGIEGLSLDDLDRAMRAARSVKDIKKRREQEKNVLKLLGDDFIKNSLKKTPIKRPKSNVGPGFQGLAQKSGGSVGRGRGMGAALRGGGIVTRG